MELKYKVVYKYCNQWLSQRFSNINCAYSYARRMDGIVLSA